METALKKKINPFCKTIKFTEGVSLALFGNYDMY